MDFWKNRLLKIIFKNIKTTLYHNFFIGLSSAYVWIYRCLFRFKHCTGNIITLQYSAGLCVISHWIRKTNSYIILFDIKTEFNVFAQKEI